MIIQQKRTYTADRAPLPSEILEGQLFINCPDQKIYSKDNNGVIYIVASYSAGAVTLTWDYLIANWSVIPTQIGTTATGAVYKYLLGATTRYRFVPTAYDPTQDALYSTWDGATLSGLICTRGGS